LSIQKEKIIMVEPVKTVEKTQSAPAPAEYKVAENREDGTVVLELTDGRMFVANVSEGGEKPRKGSSVAVNHGGLDAEGVPVNAILK
jgi:hypothetical protein